MIYLEFNKYEIVNMDTLISIGTLVLFCNNLHFNHLLSATHVRGAITRATGTFPPDIRSGTGKSISNESSPHVYLNSFANTLANTACNTICDCTLIHDSQERKSSAL